MTLRAAVLGSPIAHSLSPVLHRAAYGELGLAGWEYTARECDEAGLPALLAELDDSWRGLSLTMPLKRAILPLLARVSPLAAEVGAVNTVTWTPDREPVGDNTDVYGLVAALGEAGFSGGSAAVVVGGGATATSAIAALLELGFAKPVVQVRSVGRAAELLAAAERLGARPVLSGLSEDADVAAALAADVVICTLPSSGSLPWAKLVRRMLAEGVRPGGVLLDVGYDPWPTPAAQVWQEAGAPVVGGFAMLLHQAVAQVRLMTGAEPTTAAVEAMRSAGLAEISRRTAPAGRP